MSDDVEIGKIEITISEHIQVVSNMTGAEINLWLDRVKNMIVTGDVDLEETAE